MLIKNANAVMKSNMLSRDIRIKDGKIYEISESLPPEKDEKIIDAQGKTLIPGIIDTHTHGAYGYIYSDILSDTEKVFQYEASQGVTSVGVTYSATGFEEFAAAAKKDLVLLNSKHDGAKFGGIHSEGPFLNVSRKGAMIPHRIVPPTVDDFDRIYDACEGSLKIITLAPEKPGAIDVIRRAVQKGVAVSAGHTDATYDEMMRAVDAGLTRMTHTFNACRPINHREPGVLGAALTDDRVCCEVICDFAHLHPAAVEMIYKLKGSRGFTAISDSEFGAGLENAGSFVIDGSVRYIDSEAGVARLEDGTICGSASSLLRGFKNLISLGIPIWEVCEMSCSNPAKALGIYDSTGSIETGKCADLVILNDDFSVSKTFVDGRIVFEA